MEPTICSGAGVQLAVVATVTGEEHEQTVYAGK